MPTGDAVLVSARDLAVDGSLLTEGSVRFASRSSRRQQLKQQQTARLVRLFSVAWRLVWPLFCFTEYCAC
ncbi:hypothetical protein JJB98_15855 [Bradyrhizobium diazoefficiens]|nr:hypothetical protein [Bradyrhizobium diazoefficiens]QQO21300.1 hypothetical protein JJB98_15855 [Bradyrhizobium diazoefficiens]